MRSASATPAIIMGLRLISTDALFPNDAWSTTIMSYFDQQRKHLLREPGVHRDFAMTPMEADIVAMQTLYGLSTTTRTGDTTYGFNSNAGGIYNASAYPNVALHDLRQRRERHDRLFGLGGEPADQPQSRDLLERQRLHRQPHHRAAAW